MDIALFGLPKSGKTSIVRVIFNKVPPQQTIGLESVQNKEVMRVNLGDNINFNIYDFPGSYKFSDPNPPEMCQIEQCGSMIFVLDVQNEPYQEAFTMFMKAIEFVKQYNEKCQIHLFIHKVEQDMFQQEERKSDLLNSIREKVNEELETILNKDQDINITYHITTIYDQTLLDAFSKVVQQVVPYVPHIKDLLDQLINMCRIEKAFLFEVASKLCISTDSNIVDLQNFSMCSEMIDVYIDISFIYGEQQHSQQSDQQSSAMIKLSDGTILLLKAIDKCLVLISIIKEEFYDRPFLIDYNIDIFKKGLKQIFDVKLG